MKEGDDFPQGDKTLRKADHQAFLREFIFDIKDGKHRILEVVPKEKTIVPPALLVRRLGGCTTGDARPSPCGAGAPLSPRAPHRGPERRASAG